MHTDLSARIAIVTGGGTGIGAATARLLMFTTVTAAEWGRYGIRANCIAVGTIASERAVAAWKAAKLDVEAGLPGIPLGRVGTPEEVANAALFFASDTASYISGQTLAVDGGPNIGGISDT